MTIFVGSRRVIGNESVPTDAIVVNTLNDLPTPVLKDGVLTIIPEAKEYIINTPISSPYPLSFPVSGGMCTFKSINRSPWTYTGTDSCFRDISAEGIIEIQGLTEWQAPNGDMWDFSTTTGFWSFQASDVPRFTNCNALGTVKADNGDGQFNIHFGSLTNFDQGLIAENLLFFEINTVFAFGNNQPGCTYFTVQGASTTGLTNFVVVTCGNGTNETIFNIKPEIQPSSDDITISGCQNEGGINGSVFAISSLTNKSVGVISEGNSFIPNNKAIGSAHVKGNVAVTDPVNSGQWYDIDFGTMLASSSIERWTLTNSTTGELRIDDDIAFSGTIFASFSAVSSGGNRTFKFRFVKNGSVLTDDIEIPRDIGSVVGVASLVVPLTAVQNDLVKMQVTRVDGTSTLNISDCTITIQSGG